MNPSPASPTTATDGVKSARLPLSDLRILDLTHAAAGPFLTMFLADMGAEVIKIERKDGGDPTRGLGSPHFGPSMSEYYVALNRNKKSIALDLTRPEEVEVARALCKQCDIVVQNFRPRVAERLGLGFEQLRALRPGLVYASISGFGTTGPWSDYPANDIIMQSSTGLMGITGEEGGGPVRIGASICDFSSGLFAMSGVLAALHARAHFPEGQHVEVSMLDSSFAMVANYIPSVSTLGEKIPRPGRAHPQIAPYQAFECSDGQYLMVGAFTEAFWRRLATLLGHAEWIADARFVNNGERLKNRHALAPLIEEVFRTRPREDWFDLLRENDIPCSSIYELHDAIKSEQAVHNRVVMQLDQDGKAAGVVRNPIKAAQWGLAPEIKAPTIGQDTREVLTSLLGMDEKELQGILQVAAIRK